jgi:hypothetical protein
MGDPFFGGPSGFDGGAFDEPTRDEFQPAENAGAIDPNEGRFGGKIYNAVVEPAARVYAKQVQQAATIQAQAVEPSARIYTGQVRPI